MESKYYSYSLIILAYASLGLLAEILIHLEINAMRFGVSVFLERNTYLIIAPLMVMIGYAAVKKLKLAE
ncbi:hypothetical protein LI82_07520 [Methanococcoides methylutens]|uniref:Uncharacterized protein n=1 Tax=Methanococcoides methylutens TaxID=2226 RepID=A0A099T1C2_METMT|nr:hypothetical protein [Methanococcoides methylutens]KGK98689.1 hypothetical protein LI82_07520 [Methanococcoides methylutens]